MSTFTTVNTPQFVALHLETTASRGEAITQQTIRSANLFAGDLLDNQPAPGGGTFPGRVLANTEPIQVGITQGAVPWPNFFGSIAGSAAGSLFSTDSVGQIFGAHVEFAFHTWLTDDTDPVLPNRRFNRTEMTLSLPGP